MRPRLQAVLLLTGVLSTAACSSPTTPSVVPAATTAVIAAAPGGIAVAGKVYDTAFRPLAGAIVEVLDGPSSGMRVTTTATGDFALRGVFDEHTRFRASRDGHAAGILTLSPRCEPCNPNFWIYFHLAVPDPPANLAGDYALTVVANEACTALPGHARRRTYSVTIVPSPLQPTPANTAFNASIGGAPLVSRLGDGIVFAVAGNYMDLYMGDLHGDPGLIEITGADSYFSIGGGGSATVTSSDASAIVADLDGDVIHCEFKPGLAPIDGSGRYACTAERAITRVVCPSRKHQLILTRR